MDSPISPKDQVWFLRVCHHISNPVYQENFLWVKTAGAWGWQPHLLLVSNVMKSGSLNLLEPSGPHRACYGTALPLTFYVEKKFMFDWNLNRLQPTLPEAVCTFMIISRLILLRMRNISDKSRRESQNTRFSFPVMFFWNSCLLWENVEKYGRIRQARNDSACLLRAG